MTSQRSSPTAAQHLERAEMLVVEGEKQVHRQKQFITAMERAGEELALAQEVLDILLDDQSLRVVARDRLLNETAKA